PRNEWRDRWHPHLPEERTGRSPPRCYGCRDRQPRRRRHEAPAPRSSRRDHGHPSRLWPQAHAASWMNRLSSVSSLRSDESSHITGGNVGIVERWNNAESTHFFHYSFLIHHLTHHSNIPFFKCSPSPDIPRILFAARRRFLRRSLPRVRHRASAA